MPVSLLTYAKKAALFDLSGNAFNTHTRLNTTGVIFLR